MLMGGAYNNATSFKLAGSKQDHLIVFNSVQFTMYYTFFFNVDAVICQRPVLNSLEIKYFLNLN